MQPKKPWVTITVISDIKSCKFSDNDLLFLDANILLSVYGPNANQEPYTYIYSDKLLEMRINKSKIFVDALVLSEFINRFSRWEYDQISPERKPPRFKQFRKSSDFKKVAEEIADSTRRIVDFAQCCDSEFGSIDILGLLDEYETGGSDFNDQVIARLCKKKGCSLVSHDGDFGTVDINILTANHNLIKLSK